MQQKRKTLGLRIAQDDAQPGLDTPVGRIMREAITRKMCVAIVYNRTPMTMAPHIIYTRHDEPFVDGVVLEREGKPPRELKLGTFKLAGLSGVTLTPVNFTAQPLYEPDNPKYEGVTLHKVSL
jgi:hypothetical protein